jgi:hypothetical protein
MANDLVKQYTQLLEELSGLRMARFPGKILPASKDEIKIEIDRRAATGIDNLKWDEMGHSLGMFVSDHSQTGNFIANLTVEPFFISILYSIWIAFHGASLLWILASVLSFLGACFSLYLSLTSNNHSFGRALLLSFINFVTYGNYLAIFARLVIYSGFYEIYISTIKAFSLIGLILSLFALYFGRHYTKGMNRIYYFLFTNNYVGKA